MSKIIFIIKETQHSLILEQLAARKLVVKKYQIIFTVYSKNGEL